MKITPEVAWYLWTRGYLLPKYAPKWITPNPLDLGIEGAQFDASLVDKVLRVFYLLRHTSGEWAGNPIILEPWQIAYIIAPIFGIVKWHAETEKYYRVITDVYVDLPRKNGKTTLAGGVALYLGTADGEEGAQVVAAATSEKQARYLFNPVRDLCLKSPAIAPHVKVFGGKIVHRASGSAFTVVSSAANALHGANLHGGIIDELHLHKSGDLVEAIETGRGSRRQPLVFAITTADDGTPNSIYSQRRKRLEDVANGLTVMPHIYGVIFAADPEDNPFEEETWAKANPNYGVSISRSFMENQAEAAKGSPVDKGSFLRLHLGIRTKQTTRFIELPEWRKRADASIVPEKFKGKLAIGGLDLATKNDMTALCWAFPQADGRVEVLWRFFVPEGAVPALDKATANAFSSWVAEGHVVVTPGDVIDFAHVEEVILSDSKLFKVHELGYDAWSASQLSQNLLAKRIPMVQIIQGYKTLSPALRETRRKLTTGELTHAASPVMDWHIDNLAVDMDAAGNVKPAKDKSADKIDGVSALANAMARVAVWKPRRSVYAPENFLAQTP